MRGREGEEDVSIHMCETGRMEEREKREGMQEREKKGEDSRRGSSS